MQRAKIEAGAVLQQVHRSLQKSKHTEFGELLEKQAVRWGWQAPGTMVRHRDAQNR